MMPTHSLSPPLPVSPPPPQKKRGKKEDRKNPRVFGDVVVKYGYIILAKAQVGICIINIKKSLNNSKVCKKKAWVKRE